MEARPKFRPDLEASRQRDSEGKERVVLKDPVSGKYFRLSHYEYQLLLALDGTRTLTETIDYLKKAGHYYFEDDAKLVVGKAAQLGLLLGTKYGSSKYQHFLKDRTQEAKKAQRFSSVYFLFIPLLNPDRFLESTLWLFRLVANKWTGLMVGLIAPGAIYLAIVGIPKLQGAYLFFFNFQNLLYLWITIALTKLIHEFSHAYVAKGYGLHVPEMGLAFLLFFPCLYCNTTDAWQLADRRQRMAISAAGIAAEAVMAVISAYIWYFTLPGMVNSIAFYLMTLSFVSTILFNGNPLLKFDGYFILSDYLRMPNLAPKSLNYVKYLFMNRVLGISHWENPARTRRQVRIFTTYGISAFVYRIFLYTGIIVGVYYRFDKLLGIMLAVLALSLFLIRPILKGLKTVVRRRAEVSIRPFGFIAFVLIVAAVMVPLFIPLSTNSVYPCYLTSRQAQKLTVPLHTLVQEVFIRDGSIVKKGDLLFRLDASQLELTLRQKQTQRDILEGELELFLLDHETLSKAAGKEVELAQVDDEIIKIKGDLETAQTSITAPFDGVVTSMDYRLQEGFQPGDGVIVGELQSPTNCVIHALVPAADLSRVRRGQMVDIWFPIKDGRTLRKRIESIRSYSERDLRDSPFSSRFGGELATEVKGDVQKDAPLEAQYNCLIYHTNDEDPIPLGLTGRMVVSSPPRSLAARLVDGVIRTINRESFL